MNIRLSICSLLLASSVASRAEALNETHVPSEAKWLVHVDCDNLRKTQVGEFLLKNVLGPKLEQAAGQLKFNVSNVLQRISSLTAYGEEFMKGGQPTGVLLINSDGETQKALEGVLVAQILADTNGPVKKLEAEHAIYSVADQVFISPQKGGPIVISKSQEELGAARELLAGQGTGGRPAHRFGDFPAVSNSFFFVGLADVMNIPEGIPARAKVLQMADGARVVLGESAEKVVLDLALRGKTEEVAKQIQQVIEGMIALVSLGQPDNPDLMALAQSTKVSAKDKMISINLAYPADKVIAKLDEELKPKPVKAKAPRAKARGKAKAKPAPAIDASETAPEAEVEESK